MNPGFVRSDVYEKYFTRVESPKSRKRLSREQSRRSRFMYLMLRVTLFIYSFKINRDSHITGIIRI